MSAMTTSTLKKKEFNRFHWKVKADHQVHRSSHLQISNPLLQLSPLTENMEQVKVITKKKHFWT